MTITLKSVRISQGRQHHSPVLQRNGRHIYPFEDMEVGDYFLCPDNEGRQNRESRVSSRLAKAIEQYVQQDGTDKTFTRTVFIREDGPFVRVTRNS